MKPGDHIDGRYRIERKLGEGGMGEVYLATHLLLERQDAIKVIHASLAGDSEFVARFLREARAINRLDHPSIVRVFDFGQLRDGRFYLVMAYVEGQPLDALLRRASVLPAVQVLTVLSQLADAIGHAHARGVVHRDLKPQNLVLAGERLMVLDFGIAKILRDDPSKLSATGQVMGTPTYMAPEQLRGVGDDPRSDLYALGCIGYELLTGAPPFSGEQAELAEAHFGQTPEWPSRRRAGAAIPRELEALIMRCLAKQPVDRFSSAPELRAHLEAIRLGPLSLPRAPGAPEGELDLAETVPARSAAGALQTQPTAAHHLSQPAGRSRLVRQLARALRDAGCDQQEFLVSLGRVTELEDTVASVHAERQVIEALAASAERSADAREASLRFALGELLFERARLLDRHATVGPAITARIDELERRLREVGEHQRALLDQITDRGLALVAADANAEEALDRATTELEPLVLAARGEYEYDPAVDAISRKLDE